jgi:hypothetical protein
MNTVNLFVPPFIILQKSKIENMEKILQEFDDDNDNNIEEVEEVYELTFAQREFENILKNEYNTFAPVPFDTEEEWEYVMTENTQTEPEPEEIVEDNDDEEFNSEDETYV